METKNMKSTKLKLGNLIMQSMKKIIYCTLIALITISCNRPNKPLVIPTSFNAQTPAPSSNPNRSRLAWEDQAESWDGNTRTYAVVDPTNPNEYFQYWSAGDAISVFFTTQNSKYILQSIKSEDKKDEGIFELAGEAVSEGTEFEDDFFYSVYPYKESTEIDKYGIVTYTFPETQHYNEDSYANGENGMIAIEPKETDEILYFQNFCSYLQLRLAADPGEHKTVKKITLIANNSTDGIAGVGEIEFYDGIPYVYMHYGATNKITLDCGSGVELSQDVNNPTKFWFVLPGGFTFTEGFSITITFDDNTYHKQSTKKTIAIARNHIKPMATFKPENTHPTGPIRYKYNDTNIAEPYPLKNTFFDEDGLLLDIIDQVYDTETNEWVVLLAGTLKTIGDNSFENHNPDLEYIKIDNNDEVPITVNNFAFYNCTADSIEIYNNVDVINESAFSGSAIENLNIYGDVTTIKNSAATGSNLEHLNITGNVGTIEEQAFAGCNDLQTVNIGNIETIGYRAFYMCHNLTEVNIPGVKYLHDGAFRNCEKLTTITLDSVITIGDNVFMDCHSLTSAVISENCTMIGEGAFCNAINLRTVYCYAANPPFIKTDNSNSSYVFDKTHAELCIYIPKGSKQHYTNRSYFKNNTYKDDPKVKATVNWWQQEYKSKLVEMEN